jgi:hypothetical protein
VREPLFSRMCSSTRFPLPVRLADFLISASMPPLGRLQLDNIPLPNILGMASGSKRRISGTRWYRLWTCNLKRGGRACPSGFPSDAHHGWSARAPNLLSFRSATSVGQSWCQQEPEGVTFHSPQLGTGGAGRESGVRHARPPQPTISPCVEAVGCPSAPENMPGAGV